MTEVPEQLLERSRARRAAIGGRNSVDDSQGYETSSAPRASDAGAPIVAGGGPLPPHPEPLDDPVHVRSPMASAHSERAKIPFWAMPVLAAIPVWAYVFVGTLSPAPEGPGPTQVGAELYVSSACSACHGVSGNGAGVGPAFVNGAIFETWPRFEDHFRWVRLGGAGWIREVGDTYGATDKPVNGNAMPGFTVEQLSDADLISVVLHERSALGGANPDSDDQARLAVVADLLFENPDMTFDEALALESERAQGDP